MRLSLKNGIKEKIAASLSMVTISFYAVFAVPAAQTVVMNFDKKDIVQYTRFDDVADYASIRRWALNRNLSMIPDRPPFADKKAHYVSRYGSSVKISNLNPNSHYTLYIDFVSFEGGNGGLVSRLDISCDGERVAQLRFGEQGKDIYALSIPRNHVMDGVITISFEEFAATQGSWGIWDMILSDGPLPEKVDYKIPVPEIKDSSADAPDPKGGKKDKPVQKGGAKEPVAKPAPKTDKVPKDVVDPKIDPVPETKSPDPAKAEPPKTPELPKVKEPDIRDVK